MRDFGSVEVSNPGSSDCKEKKEITILLLLLFYSNMYDKLLP